ncbi:MAG TPA: hypothetical protein VF532_01805 [Candidatus Angelobacter sp.]
MIRGRDRKIDLHAEAHIQRGAAGLASHFVGGTAYEVVCGASCPVLIVPQPR